MLIPRIKPITQKRLGQIERARGLASYTTWRKSVLDRDGFACQYPGCGSKEHLQVHHIRKFADNRHLRTTRFNGITLCKKHHDNIFHREHLYELLFFNIVKGNERKLKDGNIN